MIRRVRVKNFGCLKDVDVELGPLTLLLGPNASGKSTFIRAVQAVSKLLRSALRGEHGEFRLERATLDELAGDNQQPILFSVWLNEDTNPTYSLQIQKVAGLWTVTREALNFEGFAFDSSTGPFEFRTQRRGVIRLGTGNEDLRHASIPYLVYPYREDGVACPSIRPFLDFAASFGLAYRYRVNPSDLVTPTLPPWIRRDEPYTDQSGNGFVATLQSWFQRVDGRRTFDDVVLPELHTLFPHIRGIGFKRGVGGGIALEYETDRKREAVPAELESDGVNMGLFLLCIPYLLANVPADSVCLGLEEPEAGTHPFLQEQRLHYLRHFAGRTIGGRRYQIIATTHSVELVRWVRQEEFLDIARFVEHLGPEEGTKIHRLLDQKDVDRVYEAYERNPGIAWYSGLFGGVPARPVSMI